MEDKKIENLLKAIFFIVVANTLFLITIITSDGAYNIVYAVFNVIGVVLLFVGLFLGTVSMTQQSREEEDQVIEYPEKGAEES